MVALASTNWPCTLLLPPPLPTHSTITTRCSITFTTSAITEDNLSAKERRQLRQQRRESSAEAAGNWREQIEERLIHNKPKKKPTKLWTDDLNINNLALLGPQWWVIRVSRTSGHETAQRLARSLATNFPTLDFKVYFPAVKEQKKLKNGSYSTKLKPLFPGCVFFHCTLNKDIHDFIKEVNGIGGFVGSRVGNSKRQINKPKPVPINEMEAIFQQVKEEQIKSDEASKEQLEENLSSVSEAIGKSDSEDNPRRILKKTPEPSENLPRERQCNRSLRRGAKIRILSGPFAEFPGQIKELNLKEGKVTVSFKLFGKESFVDLDVDQVVLETT